MTNTTTVTETTDRATSAEVLGLRAKLEYARERLAFAESLGKPGHIARCAARAAGVEARLARVSTVTRTTPATEDGE